MYIRIENLQLISPLKRSLQVSLWPTFRVVDKRDSFIDIASQADVFSWNTLSEVPLLCWGLKSWFLQVISDIRTCARILFAQPRWEAFWLWRSGASIIIDGKCTQVEYFYLLLACHDKEKRYKVYLTYLWKILLPVQQHCCSKLKKFYFTFHCRERISQWAGSMQVGVFIRFSKVVNLVRRSGFVHDAFLHRRAT